MSHYWIFVTLTFVGIVRTQYINTGGPAAESILDPLDPTQHYTLPYASYFNVPRNEYGTFQNEAEVYNPTYQPNDHDDLQRKRRTVDDATKEELRTRRWLPNLVDTDKTVYIQNDNRLKGSPFVVQGYTGAVDENNTDSLMRAMINEIEKKSFSPWGGKRDRANLEHTWTWKRESSIREPSMPKRVRFSPWGGKRSGQMIYKPGNKGSKIIFSTTVPDLTRIVSNYSPNGERLDLAGFQFFPTMDKRHPLRILALSTKMDEHALREALPFKAFLDNLPRVFKRGHPYLDVNLNKDGKRKVKFSAWGGKRSPPIIGPIWTPAPQNLKESTLDAIVLIRNNQNPDDQATKAV